MDLDETAAAMKNSNIPNTVDTHVIKLLINYDFFVISTKQKQRKSSLFMFLIFSE